MTDFTKATLGRRHLDETKTDWTQKGTKLIKEIFPLFSWHHWKKAEVNLANHIFYMVYTGYSGH